MAVHSNSEKSAEKPAKPLIPEPAGDGYPPEKDVSTPPPGTDEAIDKDKRGEKNP